MESSAQLPPLIILALDSADPDLLEDWVKAGFLPNLADLMRRGCWGKTAGAELVCEHGAWVGLCSGISRGQHGYHYFRQLQPQSYDLHTLTGADLEVQPFWSYHQSRSRKIAIADIPDTGLRPELPGIQLLNWAIHDPNDPAVAHPPELLAEVKQIFGPQANIREHLNSNFEQDKQIYQQLRDRVVRKGQLYRHLLTQDRFDLVFALFAETHTGGHQFWKYRPGAQGSDRVPEGNELTHAIRELYQAVDQEIGLLLQCLPADANLFVVSSVGLRDQYPMGGLIEDFCTKLGYQVAPVAGESHPSLLNLMRQWVPESWRIAVSRYFPRATRERLLADQFRSRTDWQKTVAFATPSAYTSFLRVNLQGREPEGTVAPGSDYQQVLKQLEADLLQLVNPRSGQPAVQQVVRSQTLFNQDVMNSPLPDLFVVWQPVPYFIERLIHPRAEIVQQKPEFYRGSDHSQMGFFAAAGPSIQSQGCIGEASLLDLAPTFLQLLGEPIPDAMEGRVLCELLEPSVVQPQVKVTR